MAQGILAVLLAAGAAIPASAASAAARPPNTEFVDVTVTNRVARFYTNFVEVRVPLNVFRDEYTTNWIESYRTNVIDLYKTNLFQRTLTNVMTVDVTRTNWLQAYRTNVYAMTLTNWQTVIVLKTNWVTQSITNTVEMKLQAGAHSAAPEPRDTKVEAAFPAAQVIGQSQGLRIELSRTDKEPSNNQVEVQFALKSDADPAAVVRVQEWQLARPDRTVQIQGQRLKFTTELSPGNYKVTVKARLDDNSPWMNIRGAMQVGEGGVIQKSQTVALNSAP
jgi:hypothetical protein